MSSGIPVPLAICQARVRTSQLLQSGDYTDKHGESALDSYLSFFIFANDGLVPLLLTNKLFQCILPRQSGVTPSPEFHLFVPPTGS